MQLGLASACGQLKTEVSLELELDVSRQLSAIASLGFGVPSAGLGGHHGGGIQEVSDSHVRQAMASHSEEFPPAHAA